MIVAGAQICSPIFPDSALNWMAKAPSKRETNEQRKTSSQFDLPARPQSCEKAFGLMWACEQFLLCITSYSLCR